MIKIRSIMTKDVVTISQNSSIIQAAKLMTSKVVSSLPVIVEGDSPIAIITERDIIRGVLSKKKTVQDIMNKEFKVISPDIRFSEIMRFMKDENVKRFVVMENEKLIGLITETDIIEATRDFTRFHQIVQEVILTIFGLATAFFLFYFSPIGASIFRS